MHLYWISLLYLEQGTLSSSIDPQAGSFSSRNCQAGIFHTFLCDYTESRTFSSTLRHSLTSSEVPTHPNLLLTISLISTWPVLIYHSMQKILKYNQIVRKPEVPQIGRVLLLPITETQYAQNNQEFCTGVQTSHPI